MGAFADILELPASVAEVARSLFASAIAHGIKVTAWAKGSPTRSVYRSMSEWGKFLSDRIGQVADQGSISTATGEGKTVVAEEQFGIKRPGKTYATTTLLITNTAGGNYPWSPNSPLILTSSVTKKQYVSQGSGVIEPFAVNIDLPIQALEPGAASTALPGQIDGWQSSVDGLTINQPNPAIGEDELSEAGLESRCKARVGFIPTATTIGAGAAGGAWKTVATLGLDGEGIRREDGSKIEGIVDPRVEPSGAGGVIVYVGDEDGPLTVGDLALVEAALFVYATAVAVPCTVKNSAGYAITPTMQVWIGASSTSEDNDIKLAIVAAMVEYLKKVPIGGYDLGSGGVLPLRGGIEDAATDGAKTVTKVIKLAFSIPSADVPLAINERPVLTGTPTITITRVSGA